MVDLKEINKDSKSLETITKGSKVEIVGITSPEQRETGLCHGVYNKMYLIYIRKSSELINIETYIQKDGVVVRGKYVEVARLSKSFDEYDKKLRGFGL